MTQILQLQPLSARAGSSAHSHCQPLRFWRWLGCSSAPHGNWPASLAGWIARYFASVSGLETGGEFTPCSTSQRSKTSRTLARETEALVLNSLYGLFSSDLAIDL